MSNMNLLDRYRVIDHLGKLANRLAVPASMVPVRSVRIHERLQFYESAGSRFQHELETSCFISQHCVRETIIVPSLGVADLRLRGLQLRLTQFHDRAETQFVARLGEFQR